MNLAKKTISCILATVMLGTSMITGATAFAAQKQKVFTPFADKAVVTAKVTETANQYGGTDYDVDGYNYFTFTPSVTGEYAISYSATPMYRGEAANGDDVYTKNPAEVKDPKRVDDYSSVSICKEYDANADALFEYVDGVSAQEKDTIDYVVKTDSDGYQSPAPVYAYRDGFSTVSLKAGKTYYISTYSDYYSNWNSETGKPVYVLPEYTLTIAPTDFSASIKTETIDKELTVNGYKVTREIVKRTYAQVYYVGRGTDVVVPDQIAGVNVERVNGTSNENIKTLTLGNNVKSVDGFSGIKTLSAVAFNNGLETINGFYGCTALTEVAIPGTVKTVGSSAFSGCTALSKVTIADGVKNIGSYAFYGTALSAAIIPASVTSIGDCAFGYIEDLNLDTVDPTDTTNVVKDGFVIAGTSGTEAAKYAALNAIPFVDITAGCPHSNAVETTPATIFAKGKTVSTCRICGAVTTKSIKKKTFKISSLKSSKKGVLVVKAAKQDAITGYQIQYSTSKKFAKKSTKTVNVKTTKALNKTIKGLKSGKKYYVRVRAYQTSGKKTVYSSYTASKNVKVK